MRDYQNKMFSAAALMGITLASLTPSLANKDDKKRGFEGLFSGVTKAISSFKEALSQNATNAKNWSSENKEGTPQQRFAQIQKQASEQLSKIFQTSNLVGTEFSKNIKRDANGETNPLNKIGKNVFKGEELKYFVSHVQPTQEGLPFDKIRKNVQEYMKDPASAYKWIQDYRDKNPPKWRKDSENLAKNFPQFSEIVAQSKAKVEEFNNRYKSK